MTIGQQIKQARERQGIGLRELAARTGISPGYLSLVETDARDGSRCGLDFLWRICRELGLSLDGLAETARTEAKPVEWERLHALFMQEYRRGGRFAVDLERLLQAVRADEREQWESR